MAEAYKAERTISAAFQEQKQVDDVIRRLLALLLTGVGVLFIPFVGPIVAVGPIGALLLGAASGAIAGSANHIVTERLIY